MGLFWSQILLKLERCRVECLVTRCFVCLRKPIVREACVFRLQIWYEVDDAILLRHCVQLKSSEISCFEWSNNSGTQDTSSLLAMLV